MLLTNVYRYCTLRSNISQETLNALNLPGIQHIQILSASAVLCDDRPRSRRRLWLTIDEIAHHRHVVVRPIVGAERGGAVGDPNAMDDLKHS